MYLIGFRLPLPGSKLLLDGLCGIIIFFISTVLFMDTAACNLLTFLFYVVVVLVLVLLEDIILNCQASVWKYSFVYRVIDIWNSLSSDIVNACSISVFKHKLELVDFTPFVRVEFA